MTYKEARIKHKSDLGWFGYLKRYQQRTYGVPEPVDNDEVEDKFPNEEDEYKGADKD